MRRKNIHSQQVFKDIEVRELTKKVILQPPDIQVVKPEEEEEELLRSARRQREEIERDNQQLLEEAQNKAQDIIDDARAEGERIIKEAENGAFEHIKKATERGKNIVEEANDNANTIIAEAERKGKEIQWEAETKINTQVTEARQGAYDQGYKDGYSQGAAEVNRLIKRLKVVIEGAIDKREDIIQSAEEQIVNIILLSIRKIVKIISTEQEGVVIENIRAALRKIRGKETITIRINTDDLELTTEHKDEFISMVEDLKHVTILEDNRVERGGCIIETDFGSIDARIMVQLEEIIEKIRELADFTYFSEAKRRQQQEKILQSTPPLDHVPSISRVEHQQPIPPASDRVEDMEKNDTTSAAVAVSSPDDVTEVETAVVTENAVAEIETETASNTITDSEQTENIDNGTPIEQE